MSSTNFAFTPTIRAEDIQAVRELQRRVAAGDPLVTAPGPSKLVLFGGTLVAGVLVGFFVWRK